MNSCRHCGHTWRPRGRKLSARCPKCGESDGVELAVVQGESEHEETMNDAWRGGIRYVVGLILIAIAAGWYVMHDGGKDAHAEPPPKVRHR